MNFRTGDDIYSFDAAAPFFKTIWDAGGNDTITVGNFAENCLIDLTPGSYSNIRIVSAPIPPNFTVTGGTQPTYDGTGNLGIAYGAIIENAIGGSGADTLVGNNANNCLDGGAGADTMIGGTGNDTYVVDNTGDITTETSTLATEIDTVQSSLTWTLGTNLENLTLTGTEAINGTGNGVSNTLTGNSAANTLDGGAGNDTLNGGAGVDTMIGGSGNDTYVVDSTGDITTETSTLATEIDTVQSSVTRTLGTNLENLTLTGIAAINGTGNELSNTLMGNSAANTLDGGAGNDTLNGGAGVDTMIGGSGNDTYVVDNSGDITTETSTLATEIDTVQSSITRILGVNLENLTLTGTAAINGIGNTLNNTITGNVAANVLNGDAGADTMMGGQGNDIYVVDNAGDVVTELLYKGNDTVQSSINYTLGANVEKLTLTGSAAINGTGNKLNNTLTGNAAANILNGGAGIDTMTGGADNDIYIVDNLGDLVIEGLNKGNDTVQSSITYSLADTDGAGTKGGNVENLTLTGTAAINGTGNLLNNSMTGNAAANILNAGAGADRLDGGLGNDTLIGGAGNDTYQFGRNGGADKIQDTAGADALCFAQDVSFDQLWFSHVLNNLEVGIIGGADKITVQDWYLGAANRVEQIQAGGMMLSNANVENLVQAMAAFAPPSAGQTTLPPAYQTTLNPVIAANWI